MSAPQRKHTETGVPGPATRIVDRMYPNRVDLPDDVKQKVAHLLQNRLAAAMDVQSQAKFAQWNVKGINFYQLNLLFKAVAKVIRKQLDPLADRITSLGGVANGTIRQAVCMSPVPEFPVEATAGMDQVLALSKSLSQYCEKLREASDEAEEIGDPSTKDFLNALVVEAEEQLYFLESHLEAGKVQ